jgi:hypothetical protein
VSFIIFSIWKAPVEILAQEALAVTEFLYIALIFDSLINSVPGYYHRSTDGIFLLCISISALA